MVDSGEHARRIYRAFSVPPIIMGPAVLPNPVLNLYYRGGFGDVGSPGAERAALRAIDHFYGDAPPT